LKKWGEGVSLIRGPWKARDEQGTKNENRDEDDSGEDEEAGPLDKMDSENDERDDRDQLELHDATSDGGRTARGDDYTKEDSLVDGLTNTMGSLNLVPPSIRFGRGGKNGGFGQNGRTGDPTTDSDNPVRGGHFRGRGRGRGWRGAGGDVSRARSPAVMEVDSQNMQPSVASQVSGKGAYGRGGLGWAAGRGRAGIIHGAPNRGRGFRGRGRAVIGMDASPA
jgi:hypothetical protein